MLHYIDFNETMGRGLFAVQEIQKDKVLFTAELLVLSEADTEKVNETGLKDYTFKFNETQDCIVLGDGELFNHSESPNIGYKLTNWGGRIVMIFFTLTDIQRGEQLFIDYSADTGQLVSEYKTNLIAKVS